MLPKRQSRDCFLLSAKAEKSSRNQRYRARTQKDWSIHENAPPPHQPGWVSYGSDPLLRHAHPDYISLLSYRLNTTLHTHTRTHNIHPVPRLDIADPILLTLPATQKHSCIYYLHTEPIIPREKEEKKKRRKREREK
mmetsp:Transcript_42836/g.130281  ORF Transcript_42836/g.130281 Transcript_42836/m.130281 type:complete len:137 (+) Transcript_42836:886-1296(+)